MDMWLTFLLCCSMFTSTLGQQSLPNYLLLVPAQIDYPSTETVCVDISGASETLNVTVTLQHANQDETLLQLEMTEPRLLKCTQFKSPRPDDKKEEVISIHISIIGLNTRLSERKNMLVSNMGSFTLIQTDKPMYKPGQTVNIRILIFNRDLLAVNDNCPLVEIQDSNGIRIGQWLNLTPNKGIIDLSFPLDATSQLGNYKITTSNVQQEFHVSEYEVPKFEVTVSLPGVVTLLMETFPIKICGRYNIGKPVQGEIRANVCRDAFCHYWDEMHNMCPQDLCMEYSGRTNKDGCLEMEVETEPFLLNSYKYMMKVEAEASLIEDGTGTKFSSTSSSRVSAIIAKVTFEETEASDSYYKAGLRYKGRLRLVDAHGSPMKSKNLYVTENYDKETRERVFETDEKGEVCFSLDTKPWNGHTVFLKASYQKKKPERVFGIINPYSHDAHMTLNPFNSAANSFLKVQPSDQVLIPDRNNLIEIDYLIRGSEMMTQEDTLAIRYVVVARGNLVMNGEQKINVNRNSVSMGTMEVRLPVTASFSPLAHILAYTILGNGHIAADTEIFHVAKAFSNKVTLAFSDEEVSPDSQATLHVRAQPGSVCSVRSVDAGVLRLKPESDITSDVVFNLLAKRRRYGYPHRVRENNPVCAPESVVYRHGGFLRNKRSLHSAYSSGHDVFSIVEHTGLKILTNTDVRKPVACSHYPQAAAMSQFGGVPFIAPFISNDPVFISAEETDNSLIYPSISAFEMNQRVRRRFPETLLSQLVTVNESGQADIKIQVPDSITEWKATAFCMGDDGLGIANATTMKSFQPFFVSMTLPNCMVKGETFLIKVTLSNYLPHPMMVQASLNGSPQIKVNECPTCTVPQCLHPDENMALTWEAEALRVGNAELMLSAQVVHSEEYCRGEKPIVPETGASDAVMRTVMIKAEGMPVEKTHNSILCGGANLSSDTISITVPPGAVPDSLTAVFSVVGDLMGSPLQGAEQLLIFPKGCGEQTMVRFVLNIFVTDYLESTNQLTPKIREQGINNMWRGYRRQLDFRRHDGSFSAFGTKDDDGNAWLTAFVIKCLYAASTWISVDKKYIEETGKWLKENQLQSGCFQYRGKIFKATLQGGVNDNISLSAYITAAFLEIQLPVEDTTIQKALECLRSSIPLVDSLYTKSLLAYVFTLAKDYKTRDILLQELHEKAVNIQGETYWPAQPGTADKKTAWSEPNSNEVESASYLLLAYLSSDTLTTQDMIKAASIAKGIAQQRNPHGGFVNTQDTVVGFQALTKFFKTTYTKFGTLVVTLSTEREGTLKRFFVDEETRLLLQKKQLTKLPENYMVQVEGEGCVYIQTALKYNVPTAKAIPAFDIQVNVTVIKGENIAALNLTISVRYTGPRNTSNMVLVQAELPSGFDVNKESLEKMTKGLVKKTESEDDHVNIYISELGRKFETFSFTVEEKFTVENHKSKMVRTIDYYASEEEAVTTYDVPRFSASTTQ